MTKKSVKKRVNVRNPKTGERQVGILENGKIKIAGGEKIKAKEADYKEV